MLGELVLPHGGAVWTATVVRGLGLMGIEAGNARQALARLADQGLVGATPGGPAGPLAPDRRRPPAARRRHRADLPLRPRRRRLGRALAGGAVVRARGPAGPAPPAAQSAGLRRLRLPRARGRRVAPPRSGAPRLGGALRARPARRCRRAPGRSRRPGAGGGAAGPGLGSRRPGRAVPGVRGGVRGHLLLAAAAAAEGDEACLAALLELVHEWRRFPFVDPEIPDRLLPAGWAGRRAKELFDERHAAWSPGARRWYEDAERGEG